MDDLSGAALIGAPRCRGKIVLPMQFLLPEPSDVEVLLIPLDRQRFPTTDKRHSWKNRVRVRQSMSAEDRWGQSTRTILQRTELYTGWAEIEVPVAIHRQAAYWRIQVRPRCLGQVETEYRLEFSRQWLPSKSSCLWKRFWLFSDVQANRRLEAIARHFRLFDRDDETSVELLTRLVFAIRSGIDSPIWTESLTEGGARCPN